MEFVPILKAASIFDQNLLWGSDINCLHRLSSKAASGNRPDQRHRHRLRRLRQSAQAGRRQERLDQAVCGGMRLQAVPLRHIAGPQRAAQRARVAAAGHEGRGFLGQLGARLGRHSRHQKGYSLHFQGT